jgi:hypothetical protein
VALAIIAAITLVQLVIANSDLTGTFGAVASMWLAVHLVPVSIAGQQLGVLPLAPAGAMVWATARTVAQVTPARGSWFVIRWIIASALGGPLLIAAVCLAVVHDAASVINVLQTPNALSAFSWVLAIHGLGVLIALGPRLASGARDRFGLPGWIAETIRPAVIGVLTLLALSAAVVAGSLVVHWGTMHELFGITDSFFGQLSLALLSLLYLPNVVVGAAAVAVGSSAQIGFATFSAFTVFGGDIPALPVLAAAPTPPLGPVWVALLIVGAAAGVALGQQCALKPAALPTAVAKLAVASALAAVILALLGFAGGGPLGNFGMVGVDQATFAPGAFIWFFFIGAMTVVMAGGITARPRKPAPVAPVAEPDEAFDSRTDSATGDDEPITEALAVPAADGSESTPDEPQAAEESDTEPAPPLPPVAPAPEAEDVEDLMFVDADIETGESPDGSPR